VFVSRQERRCIIERNQKVRELECIKVGSTKFSNYSKQDINYLFVNIEIEIRNFYASEQNKTKSNN